MYLFFRPLEKYISSHHNDWIGKDIIRLYFHKVSTGAEMNLCNCLHLLKVSYPQY